MITLQTEKKKHFIVHNMNQMNSGSTDTYIFILTVKLTVKDKKYKTADLYILVRDHIDGLVQERRNSIAKALRSLLSCTDPSILSDSTPWGRMVLWILVKIISNGQEIAWGHRVIN